MKSISKAELLRTLPGAKRIGKGQRWIIELADGKRCLVKTNARDSLMVRTSSGSPDAEIVGFGDDYAYVLVVVGSLSKPSAWLVPAAEVERQFRENHSNWLEGNTNRSRENTTWVLRDLAERFAGFEFELSSKPPVEIDPEQARLGLAAYFKTSPENIRITVDV